MQRPLKPFVLLLALASLAACGAKQPTLYPNETYTRVGKAQADADIAACEAKAKDYVKSGGNNEQMAKDAARNTAGGAVVGAAGGAAHLAGVLAAKTELPVLAVPMPSRHLQGLDSLLAMVQMPGGIPVATFAIGEAGAVNAALFTVAMLALNDTGLAGKLSEFRANQTEKVLSKTLPDLP